jgi:flagellar motility protein MotE (MotC chaperone)
LLRKKKRIGPLIAETSVAGISAGKATGRLPSGEIAAGTKKGGRNRQPKPRTIDPEGKPGVSMARLLLFIGTLSGILIGVLVYEIGWVSSASASGHGGAAPAPAANTPPSHAELRERYRKRMEEIAQAKEEEAKAPETPVGSSEKDVQALHELLKDREKKLADREKQISEKENELKEKQAFLEQQLGKYEATVARLQGELKALEKSKDDKVSAFQQVYEKMEAKKAARILDSLDPDLTGRILSGLKQKQAAEILSLMDPEKARLITKRSFASTPKP